MINRRRFIALLTAAAAGASVDLDFLKWEQGARTFFDAPAGGWGTGDWTSGLVGLTRGDIITIDGVFSINPMTLRPTGHHRQFVVTTDVKNGAFSISPLPIHPPIITSGPYPTVTAAPGRRAKVRPLFVGKTVPITVDWKDK